MAPTQTNPLDQMYTCPMHPEVQQSKAGHCPQCGMKLEQKTRTE